MINLADNTNTYQVLFEMLHKASLKLKILKHPKNEM